jgi:hypothetical protein
MAPGGCGRAEQRCDRERRRGVQKPLAACQGKTVPGAVQLVVLERSVPGGPPRPPAAGNPGSVRRPGGAPNPGQRRRRCRVRAWFESEGRHLFHLVADAQHEVGEGAANDGVGAFVQAAGAAVCGRPASRTLTVRGRGRRAAAAAAGGRRRCCVLWQSVRQYSMS